MFAMLLPLLVGIPIVAVGAGLMWLAIRTDRGFAAFIAALLLVIAWLMGTLALRWFG
jgi:hypothetical protein